MSETAEARFAVDGRRFHLSISKGQDTLAVDCSDETKDSPIATAVATAWMHDPREVLEAVDGRTGLSFEGEVSFEHSANEPSLPPGVTASVFGRVETVSVEFFARFVIEFGLAYLDASERLGMTDGEPLRQDLMSRRGPAR